MVKDFAFPIASTEATDTQSRAATRPPASKQLSPGRIPESIEKGDLPTVSGCGLTGFS
jgi:hypothetical protein